MTHESGLLARMYGERPSDGSFGLIRAADVRRLLDVSNFLTDGYLGTGDAKVIQTPK